MSLSCRILFFSALILLIQPGISIADWINLSGAENSRNIAEIFSVYAFTLNVKICPYL